MMEFENLLRLVVKENASDLILKTGSYPAVRIDGNIKFVAEEKLKPEFTSGIVGQILDEALHDRFLKEGEIDAVFQVEDIGRFRVNLFRHSGDLGLVFRHVKRSIPTFEELTLPGEQLKRLAGLKRGLILVTGVAGSGKSTTLASMIEFVNRQLGRHVVTIEDPIEFVFEDKLSVVSQREVGVDTLTFSTALKHCVRQSPDIIMIGEMRDKDTMDAAINAAETGHLVLSTLHTVNAVQTVERIISVFPPHQHGLLRLQLAMVLQGVISMRLIQRKDAGGRVPAVELMLNTPTIREVLMEGRTAELTKYIAEGHEYYGTRTFNQSLKRLVEVGAISYDDALASSDDPDELGLELRGITKGNRAAEMAGRY